MNRRRRNECLKLIACQCTPTRQTFRDAITSACDRERAHGRDKPGFLTDGRRTIHRRSDRGRSGPVGAHPIGGTARTLAGSVRYDNFHYTASARFGCRARSTVCGSVYLLVRCFSELGERRGRLPYQTTTSIA